MERQARRPKPALAWDLPFFPPVGRRGVHYEWAELLSFSLFGADMSHGLQNGPAANGRGGSSL